MFRSPFSAATIPIIAAGLLAAACGGPAAPDRTADGRIRVAAGFYPLAELAESIGGDAVDVENLTPAGSEAHDLELSPSQVDAVLDADLVVLLAGGFQPAIEAAAERRDGPTLMLGSDVAPGEAGESDDDESEGQDGAAETEPGDPHVWLDPREFADMAIELGEALAGLTPRAATGVERRAREYADRLKSLDAEFEQGLKRCERRVFVTTHAAFRYLAAAYELEQQAIAGLDPASEPDPGRMAALVDLLTESGATSVFVEPLAPSGAADVLAREARVEVRRLDPLESLTAAQVEAEADYFSVMRANLAALRAGLECL